MNFWLLLGNKLCLTEGELRLFLVGDLLVSAMLLYRVVASPSDLGERRLFLCTYGLGLQGAVNRATERSLILVTKPVRDGKEGDKNGVPFQQTEKSRRVQRTISTVRTNISGYQTVQIPAGRLRQIWKENDHNGAVWKASTSCKKIHQLHNKLCLRRGTRKLAATLQS